MNDSAHNIKVTVLLPVYNAAEFLREAIDSILSQTFSDFELLIINDGSTDSSAQIIASFADKRIRVLNNERNIGIIATLNRGIEEARGEYIARMDADDISFPERLSKQVQALDSDPHISVISCFVDFINVDGRVTGVWNTDRTTVSEKEIRTMMMRTNCIAHPGVMMRREIALKFLYNSQQKGTEDWDLWMRMLASGFKIAKLPEVLLHYRIHPGSISGKDKASEILEIRLIRSKRKFLFAQFLKLKINGFFFGVMLSLTKNRARHVVSNKLPHWGRDTKRFLTSMPWRVIAERNEFRKKIEAYSGRHFFIFPYTHVGGAEKVHAAIVEAIKAHKPLVIFSSFSDNRNFLSRFSESAEILDIAHYINYPLTRKKAKRLLATKINSVNHAVCFGSNAGLLYDLIPVLSKQVKVIDLIHAFKYQAGANLAHRKLLSLATRFDERIFVSGYAMKEFSEFYFRNNVPELYSGRLRVIDNAVRIPDSKINSSVDRPGILFVGRDSPEKRVELFLEIAKLLETELPGKFRFTVVGNVSNDSSFPFVNFVGEIVDDNLLNAIYDQHDILVLTSSREGFPVVIMEAMSHQLAVIATPVGDIPNRLNDTNGIVLSSAEAKSVVIETVKQIKWLTSSPETLKGLQDEAYRFACENFSEQKFRAAYSKLLE